MVQVSLSSFDSSNDYLEVIAVSSTMTNMVDTFVSNINPRQYYMNWLVLIRKFNIIYDNNFFTRLDAQSTLSGVVEHVAQLSLSKESGSTGDVTASGMSVADAADLLILMESEEGSRRHRHAAKSLSRRIAQRTAPVEKFHYPEMFAASPSTIHDDIFFIHILQFQY